MSGNLTEIITTITNLLLFAVPIAVAFALLLFFWGLAEFILNAAEIEKLKKARERMIWGLVALFVILSLGGLVSILKATVFGSPHASSNSNNTLSIPTNTTISPPIVVPPP